MIYQRNSKWLFPLLALIIALLILLPANALSAWNDVTASVALNRTRPLYNYVAKTNYFDGSLTNTSGESFQPPIRLVIDSVTTPQVTVHNADGVTDDNKPYFDFSGLLGDGTLDPGETSSAIQFEFYNPNRLRFNFTWKILVEAGVVEPPVNQSPVLDPIADQIIPEGGAYTYAVTAKDPDQDSLTFGLTQASQGMTIDPTTGLISWTSAEIDVGLHEITVQVSDGNGGTDTQTYFLTVTQVIVSTEGFIVGEVFDDTTGLPVSGALVRVISAHGQPLAQPMETTTDDRGRYQFYVPEGKATIMIKKDGHSSGYRELSVLPDRISYPLDARITPLGSGRDINRLIGGNVITPDNQIQLYVPPGTFSEDKSVTLTKLSGQGLSGLLPPGWTPMTAIHMGPENESLNSSLELTITGSGTLVGLVGVVFDMASHQWVRLETSTPTEGDGVVISVPQMGVVAMVKPDTHPAAPAIPKVGSALTGVALDAIPEGVTADILPAPKVIFMQPGAKSFVWASLNNTQPLPSGTRIQVDFDESYERTDNTSLMPEPMTQDFILYQGQTGFDAHFVASPSEKFDAMLLKEGVIRLAAYRPKGADGTGIIGPTGGTITSLEGLSLTIPSGILASSTPVFMNAVSEADAALSGDSRFAFLQGVDVDFCGAILTASAELTITLQETIAEDVQVLVVQAVEVEEVTQYELVAIATISGNSLTATAGSSGLPLSGIRKGGRCTFLQMTEPVGYVTGTVLSGGQTVTNGLVDIDTLPFVSLLSSERSNYALATTISTSTVFGKDLTNGNNGRGTAEVNAQAQIVTMDIALTESRPTVVSVSPADDATAIAQATSVTVQFSVPMDSNTIDTASFSLREGINNIEGAVTLLPDGTTAVFQTDNPLEDNTLYTVSLSKDITDTYGQPLFGNQPDETFISTFTTVDNTPPPLPEAGQITLSIPDDGTTEIRGTQGTVEPGTIVFIFNFTLTLSTVAQAGEDGGFYATLAADPGDTIEIVIQDADGDRTTLPFIPFSGNNGTRILGPQGGEMISSDGVHVSVLPRAMIRSDAVRLTDVPLEELPDNLSSGLNAVRAFHLDVSEDVFNIIQSLEVEEKNSRFLGSAVYNTPLSISATHVSADSVGPASQFGFTAKSVDVSGTEQAVTVSASGSSTLCTSQDTAKHNTSAPRISLTAPSCLGSSQAFSLAANAVQPRFDVWIDAPEGSQEGDMFLILRPITAGGETFWIVEETATCKTIGTSLRVESTFHAPWGIRDAGDYFVVRADAPMAIIEGFVTGEEALVGTNLTSLVAMTDGNNGAFVLPVPADQGFELQVRLPEDGAMLSSTTIESINVNQTVQIGAVGPDAPEPLTVSVDFGQNEFVSSNSRIIFSFSQALDTKTIVPTSLFITNSQGQKVEGSLTPVGSMQVIFSPKTAWMMGKTYTYVVTTHVMAENGAHLIQDATGTFSGFTPTVLGHVSGTDVKDAVAIGTRAYFLDSSNLRCIDLFDPAQPSEGTTAILNPNPNRITSLVSDTTTALIVSAGSASDYGKLTLFDLENPMAPSSSGSLLVSTPSGSSAITGVPEHTAIPGSIVTLGTQVILSNKGIGLQSLVLDTIAGANGNSGPGDAMLQYPLEGNISFTDVVSFAPWLISIGPDGLQIHDVETLSPLATAEVNGTPLDVEVVQVKGRVLAIVAAGLSGGVQVFEISSEDQLNPIAQVLPGCSVTRIAADGPMNRAWLWCSNQRLMSLDLSHVDGMQQIDTNNDDADDRLGGSIPFSISLKEITLDLPRALALISAGSEGLHTLQLGPAEAAITDVRRDPVPGDFDDEESILCTGMVYSGDHQLFVTLETRIPPGHSGLRAVVESEGADVPVVFPGGGTVQILQAGANELILEPATLDGDESVVFNIKVVDAENISYASYTGTVNPVPVDEIVWSRPTVESYTINNSDPVEIVIIGQSSDGRAYNIASVVEYSVVSPEIVSFSDSGMIEGQAGGQSVIVYQLNKLKGQFNISSSLPPVLTGLMLEPSPIFLGEAGGTVNLSFTGIYSDGTRQPLTISDGIQPVSLDSDIATVDSYGNVTAVAEGVAEIQASIDGITGTNYVTVKYYVEPELSDIFIYVEDTDVPADKGSLEVLAFVRGSGSLSSLPVTFQVEGVNMQPVQLQSTTDGDGYASARITGLDILGIGTVSASMANPSDGQILSSESVQFSVVERNRDTEPNNTFDDAIPITLNTTLSGQVDNSTDIVDYFKLELVQEGILTSTAAFVSQGDAELILRVADDSRTIIFEQSSDSGELTGTTQMQAGALYLMVVANSASINYTLRLGYQPATPHIDNIVPSSGQVGDVVTVEGSGFSLDPEHDIVLFNGVPTEVILAESDLLQVIVPAFATDGPVTVSTESRTSNEFEFSTGLQGHPNADAFYVEPNPAQYVDDIYSDNMVIGDRILIAFKHSIIKDAVEDIANSLNADIVSLVPIFNMYGFEFGDIQNVQELYTLAKTIAEMDNVRFAMPVHVLEGNGFRIGTRDVFYGYGSSINRRKDVTAYEQINVFEAWNSVINSGFFSTASDFNQVKILVIDTRFPITQTNEKFFQGVATIKGKSQLKVHTCSNNESSNHGIYVAGIIGARNRGEGVNGILGGVVQENEIPRYEMILSPSSLTTSDISTEDSVAFSFDPCCKRYRAMQRPDGSWLYRVNCTGRNCNCPLQSDINIANLSYGTKFRPGISHPTSLYDWMAQRKMFYESLFTRFPHMLYVCSAGNENTLAKFHYPSALTLIRNSGTRIGKRVISVAAVGQGVNAGTVNAAKTKLKHGQPNDYGADTRAAFSNFGKAVDIAAPGTAVATPQCRGNTNDYYLFNGTSASAPMVTGVAALLKSLDDSLTAEELKTILLNTATPIDHIPAPDSYVDPSGQHHLIRDDANKHVTLSWCDKNGNNCWNEPKRLNALNAVQYVLKRRGFTPGQKRYLWITDEQKNKLWRIRIKPNFETNPSDANYSISSEDYYNIDIEGIITSSCGDKVYIAANEGTFLNSGVIYVWNTNTGSQNTQKVISLGSWFTEVTGEQMSFTPDGHFLFVPVDSGVAIIDAWQDEYVDLVSLGGPGMIGECRGVIVDSESTWYAVSGKSSYWGASTGNTGTLYRAPKRIIGDSEVWQWHHEDLSFSMPRGLALQRYNTDNYIYVNYGGYDDIAATSHRISDLKQVSQIPDNLPDRLPLRVAPGLSYPVTIPAMVQKGTGASRAFKILFDPFNGSRGWLFFYATGNIGFLKHDQLNQTLPFQNMNAVTRVAGEFLYVEDNDVHSKAGYKNNFINITGNAPAEVTTVVTNVTLYSMYLNDTFLYSADLEQQGELIATSLFGDNHRLRMFFASKLDNIYTDLMINSSMRPEKTPIDGGYYDIALPDFFPRHVAFGPQLTIISPRDGATLRGAISVNVIIRDSEVNEISTTLTDQNSNVVYMERKNINTAVGYIEPINTTTSAPMSTGDYLLEITGHKTSGREIKSQIKFKYQK